MSLRISTLVLVLFIIGQANGQDIPTNGILPMIDPESIRMSTEGATADDRDAERFPPLDLNGADVGELSRYPGWSVQRAQALVAHRNRFGRLHGIEELTVIEGFDTAFIRSQKLQLEFGKEFIHDRFRLSTLLSAARHELLFRTRISPQDRVGFSSDGDYPFYLGDPVQATLRYRVQADRHFSAGFLLEKDPGELWLNQGRFDFFSWHIYGRPQGKLQAFCIGDFQLQFGQGLVLWRGLSIGKGNDVAAAFRRGTGIRPYASAGESGFFRGTAFSLKLRDWTADTWVSYRKVDAGIVPSDTLFDNLLVSSLYESGLHRTFREIENRGILGHFSTGLHAEREIGPLRFEFTAHHQRFSIPLWAGDDPYERFDPEGRAFFHAGIAGRYAFNNGNAYGEFATDQDGDPAFTGGMVLVPDHRFSLSWHYRNFSRGYMPVGPDAFRESSKTQNEKGLYAGFSWDFHRKLKWQGFVDRFAFPWLKYTQSSPVEGTEWGTQIQYIPSRTRSISLRYREEHKPVDHAIGVVKEALPTVRKGWRWEYSSNVDKAWMFHARIEQVQSRSVDTKESGTLFFADLRYKPLGKPYSISVRRTVYRTEGYGSRIYSFEQDLAGGMNIPAFHGEGRKWYALLRLKLAKGIDLWLRYSREIQSVEGSRTARDEIKSQIRWEF